MKIRPLHDRVLVKRIEQQEQVRGGIIIPDTAKEKPQEAEVVAVGPGKVNDEGKRVADGRQGRRPHPRSASTRAARSSSTTRTT